MKASTYRWTPLLAALILAFGLAVVWGMVFMYSAAIVMSMGQDANRSYESLSVTLDGTPVIGTYAYTGHVNWTYRTLEGKRLDRRETDADLMGATFVQRSDANVEPEDFDSWSARVTQPGISDGQLPATNWFVVRDDQPEGRSYLVGFDVRSRLVAGYLGRKGFSTTLPPEADWFEIGPHALNSWGGGLLSNNQGWGAQMRGTLIKSSVYLVDGDKLIDVDLATRTVKTLAEVPGLQSIASIMGRRDQTRERSKEAQAEMAKALATGIVSEEVLKSMASIQQAIALRSAERITIVDPDSGSKRDFTMPQSLRSKGVTVYELPEQKLLYVWGNRDNQSVQHLSWATKDGTIQREEKVALVQYRDPMNESKIIPVLGAPVPVGWLVGLLMPISENLDEIGATYRHRIARRWNDGWQMFVSVFAIGIALAGWTYYLQQKYHRPMTIAWCGFVFLVGWPGFLAYLFEHRRAKLEACKECKQVVPRDRGECAVCTTPFSAPAALGTEIFA